MPLSAPAYDGVAGTDLQNLRADALRHWRVHLANAVSGAGVARLNVYGDSITVGSGSTAPNYRNGWVGKLRAMLAERYTMAGSGVNAGYGGTYAETDPRIVMTGGWTQFDRGIMAHGTVYNTGATNTFTFTPDEQVTSFNVYYLTGAAGGTFNISVDGGADTPVNSNGSAGYGKATISAGSLNTHTLTIKPPASGNVYVCGVEGITTSGIALSRLGVGGASSYQVSLASTGDNPNVLQFDLIPPDLSIIALGTNDFLASTSVAAFQSQIQAGVTKALATGDCILFIDPAPSDVLTPTYPEYAAAIKAVAKANGIPYFDFTARWGDYSIANAAAYGLMGDNRHPNNKGHQEMALALYKALGFA